MNLSDKETKAMKVITEDALEGMGGNEPNDLHNDNFSWFNESTISKAGFNKHESAGIMSSLERKGLIIDNDPDDKYGWCLTSVGIDTAQNLDYEWGLDVGPGH